jgi:plastocyanin
LPARVSGKRAQESAEAGQSCSRHSLPWVYQHTTGEAGKLTNQRGHMSNRLRISTTVLLLSSAAALAQAQRVTITGTIKYDGPQINAEFPVTDQARKFCGPTTSAHVSVDPGRVSNVVVFLEGAGPVEMNGQPIELRNVNCAFEPALQVAEAGARLTLVNHDPMLHVVQMYRSGLRVGEYQLFRGNVSRTDRDLLGGPGLIEVQCRWHTWMRSTIWVFDHPYYAVTNEDGTFTLPFVMPGSYRLSIWHAQLGMQSRDITVVANQVLPVEFVYQRIATQ